MSTKDGLQEIEIVNGASPAHFFAPDLCKKAVSVIAVAEFCTLPHNCRCCCCDTEPCCIRQGAALSQRQYQSSHHTVAGAHRAPDRHRRRRKMHRQLSSGEQRAAAAEGDQYDFGCSTLDQAARRLLDLIVLQQLSTGQFLYLTKAGLDEVHANIRRLDQRLALGIHDYSGFALHFLNEFAVPLDWRIVRKTTADNGVL